MRRLFILGFCSEYGGAGSELRAQIHLWSQAFPEIELHLIPTQQGWQNEPLYPEMQKLNIKFHEAMDFSAITPEDAIINFCSDAFLSNLETISQFTKRIVFVNCMTFIFPKEKAQASKNYISHHLYQRPQILEEHRHSLQRSGSKAQFLHFKPYFHPANLEYSVKDQEKTHIGRISRADGDKFSKLTNQIYGLILSPKEKQGHFLGWGDKSQAKMGKPLPWIKTYASQRVFPVKDFYDQIDFIVQPTDTFENLPRIGFEAMHCGKPLVVDNRGGWQYLIEHGVSGFLCNTDRDFSYWGSRLSYDLDLCHQIAENARQRVQELGSFESSKESWAKVFESVYQ